MRLVIRLRQVRGRGGRFCCTVPQILRGRPEKKGEEKVNQLQINPVRRRTCASAFCVAEKGGEGETGKRKKKKEEER